MTNESERRTPHAQDHEDRGADAAGAGAVKGLLAAAPAIVTAPRCGHDRRRPRLKPTIEVIPDGNRLILMRSGRQNGDIALDGDPRVLGELLRQLDGARGPAAILASLRATVAPALTAQELSEALDALAADGLIE